MSSTYPKLLTADFKCSTFVLHALKKVHITWSTVHVKVQLFPCKDLFSFQFKVLQDGCWQKINFKRNLPSVDVEPDSCDVLNNPWIRHFKHSGKHCTNISALQSYTAIPCGEMQLGMARNFPHGSGGQIITGDYEVNFLACERFLLLAPADFILTRFLWSFLPVFIFCLGTSNIFINHYNQPICIPPPHPLHIHNVSILCCQYEFEKIDPYVVLKIVCSKLLS